MAINVTVPEVALPEVSIDNEPVNFVLPETSPAPNAPVLPETQIDFELPDAPVPDAPVPDAPVEDETVPVELPRPPAGQPPPKDV